MCVHREYNDWRIGAFLISNVNNSRKLRQKHQSASSENVFEFVIIFTF